MKPAIASASVRRRSLLLTLAVLLATPTASQHHRPFPVPPEPADPQATAQPSQPNLAPKARVNSAHLQQEVQELSSLAQDLTQDIDAVNRGLLPKDTVDKLKRVEKLAKRLRKEIAP